MKQDTPAVLRVSLATWAPAGEAGLLRQRAASLASALQGWGVCQGNQLAGDPLAGVMSSAPGIAIASTAPTHYAPLRDVLTMMPWNRVGSPWEQGAVLWRTFEGRPFPYDPVGSLRQMVFNLICGEPGHGKSMLSNTTILGLCLSHAAQSAGGAKLPLVGVLDIGPSAKGLVDLLRIALPREREHEALYVRYEKSPDYAVNIFDTQLGFRHPLPLEMTFLQNVISLACTPIGHHTPFEGMDGLVSLTLSEAYRLYAPARAELLAKIRAAPAKRFKHTRPHGVLLCIVTGIAPGKLLLAKGDPIPIRGRISVFGEREGNGRDGEAERAARAPYLAACLVARSSQYAPPEVLKAYCHPCVAAHHLMLVDSNLERRTLKQLLRLQSWLQRSKAIRLSIEKPLFDIAAEAASESEAAGAREPCIPDFILRAEGAPPRGQAVVVIETMGYADAVYRMRKGKTQALMIQVLGGAPLVHHDFHLPAGRTQEERDASFWREVRRAVIGSGQIAGGVANRVQGGPRDSRIAHEMGGL